MLQKGWRVVFIGSKITIMQKHGPIKFWLLKLHPYCALLHLFEQVFFALGFGLFVRVAFGWACFGLFVRSVWSSTIKGKPNTKGVCSVGNTANNSISNTGKVASENAFRVHVFCCLICVSGTKTTSGTIHKILRKHYKLQRFLQDIYEASCSMIQQLFCERYIAQMFVWEQANVWHTTTLNQQPNNIPSSNKMSYCTLSGNQLDSTGRSIWMQNPHPCSQSSRATDRIQASRKTESEPLPCDATLSCSIWSCLEIEYGTTKIEVSFLRVPQNRIALKGNPKETDHTQILFWDKPVWRQKPGRVPLVGCVDPWFLCSSM